MRDLRNPTWYHVWKSSRRIVGLIFETRSNYVDAIGGRRPAYSKESISYQLRWPESLCTPLCLYLDISKLYIGLKYGCALLLICWSNDNEVRFHGIDSKQNQKLLWFMNGLMMLDCFLRQNAGLYTIWVVLSFNMPSFKLYHYSQMAYHYF